MKRQARGEDLDNPSSHPSANAGIVIQSRGSSLMFERMSQRRGIPAISDIWPTTWRWRRLPVGPDS